MRMDVQEAAAYAEASYAPSTHSKTKNLEVISRDEQKNDDVQAHYLPQKQILLIPGTNSLADWRRYNTRVVRIGSKRLKFSKNTTERGLANAIWHQGFMAHARAVQQWQMANKFPIRFIIGHSLGAASAQILCKCYPIYGIGFAAPRTRPFDKPLRNDKLCLLINRHDDTVCGVPDQFHHCGVVHQMTPRRKIGMDHSMPNYIAALPKAISDGQVPRKWGR